jgi:hypothetical protein
VTLSLRSAHEWRISTRARGEVLTAAARSERCQFLILGVPDGHTTAEVEAWLGDLQGVAAESTRNDQNPRPIPRLLHHALTGLLFSHREVWNIGAAGSTFSLAFVEEGEEAGFGWVGDAQPSVWIDDQPVEARWIRVRDHSGREACAFSAPAGARVQVSLEWNAALATGEAGVKVEAVWGAGAGVEPEMIADDEPDAAPFTMAEVVGPWAEAAPAASAAAPSATGLPPEAPAGESGSAPGVTAAAPAAAHAPAKVIAEAAAAPQQDVGLPELIPPSPEPPDLTARALRPQPEVVEPAWVEPPAATAVRPRPRPRMSPAWPSEQEISRSRRGGVPPWMWIAGALAIVMLAWLAGILPGVGRPGAKGQGWALFGLGGARFSVAVDSRPPGAWIAADGKDLAVRTPSNVELAAGEHQITLSFPDLGSAAFTLRGARGDRQALSAPLWGTLSVRDADASVPIAVDLDGSRLGYAPLTVDSLAPGAHELRFSGPGLTPWGQALRVRVAENTEVIARPMTTPANGVLEVRATFTDGNGTNALEGASVWVDGERRGVTPLVLELPRGPHSARVEYRGERAPVQVLDLPGGNQRFASFEMGLNVDAPTLDAAPLPAAVPLGRPTVVSASLSGITSADVKEMWLNVREPDGPWRRYQMVMLKAPDGVVGVALFPIALFDARGNARYYVSAADQTGDEYFTEIVSAHSAPRQGAPRPE